MGVLASFVKFKVDFSAGSGSLGTAENGQFVESRTVPAGTPIGYYSQHVFEIKSGASTWGGREKGMFGIHWMNTTSGEPDSSWDSTDFSTTEGAIEAMFSALVAKLSNEVRLSEHRWYAYGSGINPPTPPTRVTTLGTPITGTSTVFWPRQIGTTVTLRTTLRRHWGRIYLPISPVTLDNFGQMSSGQTDAVASAARTALLVTPATRGIVPVVYDRNRKILFGVTQLEVDSIPDVQRRRRPRDTQYRKIYTS